MSGYVPGEQPRVGERIIKLNTNEAPFAPVEHIAAALRNVSAEQLRKYPDPQATAFRQAVAKRHGVNRDQILAGNGSDDILTIVTRTFVPHNGRVASPWPTYSLYPTLCDIQGAKFIPVEWGDDWSLPIESLLAAKADAIFFANPNAPTGTVVDPSAVDELARRFKGIVLVDEAYADYADADCIELLKEHDNIIICRTLSKGFALAGLRLGYAVAHPDVILSLDKVRDSYNVDVLAQLIGTAAIESEEAFEPMRQHVREERARLTLDLQLLGFFVAPSQANFIFARHPEAGYAVELAAGLKRQGILVRHWDTAELRDFIRITVGTAQEITAVLAALHALIDTTAEVASS